MSISDNFENIINGTDEGIKGDLFERIHKTRKEMSPEDYKEKTDNTAALGDLMTHIEMMKQGVEVWKTGFTGLDKALGGGFYGDQLIFLGAVSSLGKTSFALQIATNIAESGKDVLIFSLEMSKKQLNAKIISRYTYTQKAPEKYRLTTRDILNGRVGDLMLGQPNDEQSQVFKDAFNAAGKIADRVRIFVGKNDIDVDKIREAVDTHIKAMKNKPFVVVDYLQILQASENARTAEKRLLTDYDVTQLKTIARDFDIPILAISAFNRTSYLEPVSTSSFRESSGIEYSSDVLLALQFQGTDYQKHYFTTKSNKKKKVYESEKIHKSRVRDLLDEIKQKKKNGEPLPIELKALKTRDDAGGDVYFHFLPAYNYFEEQDKSSYKCDMSEWVDIGDEETPFSSTDALSKKYNGGEVV